MFNQPPGGNKSNPNRHIFHNKQELVVGDFVQNVVQKLLSNTSEPPSLPYDNPTPSTNALFDVLGETTNTILYAHFMDSLGVEFSRIELREVVETRKRHHTLNRNNEAASKIQSGKLAVDYWIDFFVEKGIIIKRTSNPVLFKMVEDTISVEAKANHQDIPKNKAIAA